MSRGNRAFTTGALLLALAVAFVWVSGASAALTASGSVAAVDDKAPAAPADLVVEVDLAGPTVMLSWTVSPSDMVRQSPAGLDFTSNGTFANVNDVAGYTVWRSDGGDYAEIATVEGTSFTDDSVVSGVTYTYEVTAGDAAGNLSAAIQSEPVSLGPPPSGGEPSVPPGSTISRQARLRLGGTMDTTNQAAVEAFLADLRQTLAALLGISPGRITFKGVSQGSIIVDLQIAAATGTEPTSAAAITSLQTQIASNPNIITETAVAQGVTTTFGSVLSMTQSNVTDLDFGILGLDGTASQTFAFENTATDTAANLTVNATVTGAGFTVSPASQSIAAGASGTVTVTFTAATVQNLNGDYAGSATIRTNDPENRETVAALTATIEGGLDLPVLDLSGVSLQFGAILIGTESTKELTITNKGDLDLSAALTVVGDSSFTVSVDSVLLAGGEAAIVNVVFSPAATGAASAVIQITSNDPAHPTAAVQLNGNGVSVLAGPKRGVDPLGNTILGFMNADNIVDFDDFFLFADAFNSTPSSAAWNVLADFDESGVVDFDDFFIFADNFNKVAVSFLN